MILAPVHDLRLDRGRERGDDGQRGQVREPLWAELAARIRLAPLIIHRFPLESFPDASRTLRHSAGPRGKILLEVAAP